MYANKLFCIDDHGIEVPPSQSRKNQLKSILCPPNCNLLLTSVILNLAQAHSNQFLDQMK